MKLNSDGSLPMWLDETGRPQPTPDTAAILEASAGSQFSTTDTSTTFSAYSVTVNGFTVRGAGNAAGNVAWIATTAGNT